MSSLGDSFEVLPNFAGQNKMKRPGWDKYYQNRTGTNMGEKGCRSVRVKIELVDAGSALIDFQKLSHCLRTVLSEGWETLDDINKGSDNSTKKKLNTEEGKCASAIYCLTKYDVNIR